MNKKHITNDILPNQTYQNNKIVMNKTQQLLKSREEEFDKKFPQEDFREDMNDGERQEYFFLRDIKSFHSTTISLLLNSLKEGVEELPRDWRQNDGTRLIKLTDVLTLLSQTISNLQTK